MITSVIDNFQKFERDYEINNLRESVDFNVFNFIKSVFWLDEPKHSRIIAFLLNPEEIHGQKEIFLYLFLEMLGIKDFKNKKWSVYAEKGNVDILITSNHPFKKTIIIENKSNWAIDQDYQLYRYWYSNIFKFNSENLEASFDSDNNRVVYLSPSEVKIYTPQSIARPVIGYEDGPELMDDNIINTWYFHIHLKEWLLKCKDIAVSLRLKLFIDDYVQFWEKTNNKEKTIMQELQNYFKDKEQDWKDFVEASSYINKLKSSWFESFSQKLNSLREGEWKFDKDPNDFRWFLTEWNSLSFLYEPHKGLTLWKQDFYLQKKEFENRFKELFIADFDFEYDYESNYVMNLKDKSIVIDDSEKFYWIMGNNPELIISVIKKVLNKYLKEPKVVNLFKEIDSNY